MISFRTDASWSFSLVVTVGINVDTYSNTATSAYEAMEALVAWANSPLRPWYPSPPFSWTFRAAQVGTVQNSPFVQLVLRGPAPFELDGGAYGWLGFVADTYSGEAIADDYALGAWLPSPGIAVRSYERTLPEGDAAGNGTVRPGSPGAASYAASVEAIGTARDAAVLSLHLANAPSPRVCWVYQTHKAAWLQFALGDVSRTREDATYRFGFDVVG